MTTNDQYRDDQVRDDQYRDDRFRDASSAPVPPSAETVDPFETPLAQPATTHPAAAHPEPVRQEGSTDEVLFARDDLTGLRANWDEVQASFVDDPQQCVRQADALVSDVVDKLTTGFTTTRTRLEAQWAGGEEVSTEDLRVALTQYREFFQRLLAV